MAAQEQPYYLDRIVINPAILAGKPVIKGTRIPVSLILNLLASGADIIEVVTDYPDLSEEDIRAAIAYAADRVDRMTNAPFARPV